MGTNVTCVLGGQDAACPPVVTARAGDPMRCLRQFPCCRHAAESECDDEGERCQDLEIKCVCARACAPVKDNRNGARNRVCSSVRASLRIFVAEEHIGGLHF